MNRPFKRIQAGAWLGGICGGLAYAVGWPTWVVRLILVLSVVCLGFGILAYLLLWIFVPRWPATPADYALVTGS